MFPCYCDCRWGICLEYGHGIVYFMFLIAGEVYAWGMGTSNQLGQTDEDEDFWEPVQMTGKQLDAR